MPPLVASVDPRIAQSLLAVERALAWYIAEVPRATAPPVSEAEAIALRSALQGLMPWIPEQFGHLVTFGRSLFRLARLEQAQAREVPSCTLGDCLVALAARDVAPEGTEPWRFDPQVDREAFAKLEFRATSLGIEKAQRDNREGWWAHAQKNRGYIESAARAMERRQTAVVLGAGHAFDLPIAELARLFDRVVLADIDGEALEKTAAAIGKDPALAAKLETRVLDFTGINGALVHRLDERLDGPGSADDVVAAVERLCRSYRLARVPLLPADERADLIVSSCVMTQLAWPQRVYGERRMQARFGPMASAVEARWSTAWSELGLRVQQDHIEALLGAADLVVLTSDVVSHRTVLDARGLERDSGRQVFALGVDGLEERFPRHCRAIAPARWAWSRYKATKKGGEGSRMDVEGWQLSEPRSAGGLWLPGAA